jgi:hypothetical protein
MDWKIVVRRVALSMLVGVVFGFVLSEVGFHFQKNVETRPPQQVELLIPAGTAERVAQGQSTPSLPAEMKFVVGDTLVVRNEDLTTHQLGPLVVPPGSSASLVLDQEQNYAFQCSFQPTKYLGLDVQEPLTITTRLTGVLFGGLPMGALLAVYSLVAWPIKKEVEE